MSTSLMNPHVPVDVPGRPVQRQHRLGRQGRHAPVVGLSAPSLLARPRIAGSRVLATGAGLEVSLAGSVQRIDQALALRHRVFVLELGARPETSCRQGLEHDLFDPYCEHLVVTDPATDRVVATSRILLPRRSAELGRLYADGEFRLEAMAAIRPTLAEIGRTCVAADHRNGATIRLLFAGMRSFLDATDVRFILGAASVPMHDGGFLATALHRHLARHHAADPPMKVSPRRRLPTVSVDDESVPAVPSLLRNYLRMGSRLLGAPHHDTEFGCADFPLLAQVDRIDWRMVRR